MARTQPKLPPDLPGQRGRQEHEMRARIVAAALSRFRREGYAKTSVADIAGDLGVTSAYLYKFFASKIAICEAVCSTMLGRMDSEIEALVAADVPASSRFEDLYLFILKEMTGNFFAERKLHDMVHVALEAHWASVEHHKDVIRSALRRIIADGVARGEFAGNLDQDAAATAAWCASLAFCHPTLVEQAIDEDLQGQARAVATTLLRAFRCKQ
jgi:AcrR family transcriptional regulator